MPRTPSVAHAVPANSNSSLAVLVAMLMDPDRGQMDPNSSQHDELEERWNELVRKLTAVPKGDWHGRLRLAGELGRLCRSPINRLNSKKTVQRVIETCRRKTGLNPIKFHALTVILAAERQARGIRPNSAAVRRAALLTLRPDLRIPTQKVARPDDLSESRRQRLSGFRKDADRLKSLEKILKGLLDKPGALKPIFARAEAGFDGLVSDFRQLTADLECSPPKTSGDQV